MLSNFSGTAKSLKSNKKKHDVSFEQATSVFGDVYARVIDDIERSDFEDRFIILGYSLRARLLVVCHEETYWRFFHEERV